MSMIDKQRIAKLQELGYTFSTADGWIPPATFPGAGTILTTAESDAMHAVLMRRADALQGCREGSPEEIELERIVDSIEAYEAMRWPDGRNPAVRAIQGCPMCARPGLHSRLWRSVSRTCKSRRLRRQGPRMRA